VFDGSTSPSLALGLRIPPTDNSRRAGLLLPARPESPASRSVCTLYLVFKEPRLPANPKYQGLPALPADRSSTLLDNFRRPLGEPYELTTAFRFVSTFFRGYPRYFFGRLSEAAVAYTAVFSRVCEARRLSRQPRCSRPRTSRKACLTNVCEPLPTCQLPPNRPDEPHASAAGPSARRRAARQRPHPS
jgi:hypothetical protein